MKPTEGHLTLDDYKTKAWKLQWAAHPRPEAAFAMALIERWGMVAAMDDGEDSSGRAKLRLATEDEVVRRAIEVSKLAHLLMDEEGWFIHIPPPVEREP